MNQAQRVEYLISYLQKYETYDYFRNYEISTNYENNQILLRSLMNIRDVYEASEDFLKIQDEYLQIELNKKGIVDINDLKPIQDNLYLWQGDITTLKCDAIVNAANNKLLGCFIPNHKCIDNCIHTYAGIQLRNECYKIITLQGHDEITGQAKITKAYNLPSKYILHTVGPIINHEVSKEDEELLSSCYRSCLKLAIENNINSIAFCCISTGEFHFPNELAANIAIKTVKEFIKIYNTNIKVIFIVFKKEDYDIYYKLLK